MALDAYADMSDPEAVLLILRAEELAAGLDAWTGGWFSAWRPPEGESGNPMGASSSSFLWGRYGDRDEPPHGAGDSHSSRAPGRENEPSGPSGPFEQEF